MATLSGNSTTFLRRRWLPVLAGLPVVLGACSAVDQRVDRARDMVAQMRVQAAVDEFREDYGVAPVLLAELVPEYLSELPEEFDGVALAYDLDTGKVTLAARGPSSPAEAAAGTTPVMIEQDYVNLARIDEALHSYHAMYGTHPDTLSALAPRFIDTVPGVAATGQAYAYFPETGTAYHPAELVEEAAAESAPATATETLREQLATGGAPTPQRVLEAGENVLRDYEKLLQEVEQ